MLWVSSVSITLCYQWGLETPCPQERWAAWFGLYNAPSTNESLIQTIETISRVKTRTSQTFLPLGCVTFFVFFFLPVHINLSLHSIKIADIKTVLPKNLMTVSLCTQGEDVCFHFLGQIRKLISQSRQWTCTFYEKPQWGFYKNKTLSKAVIQSSFPIKLLGSWAYCQCCPVSYNIWCHAITFPQLHLQSIQLSCILHWMQSNKLHFVARNLKKKSNQAMSRKKLFPHKPYNFSFKKIL